MTARRASAGQAIIASGVAVLALAVISLSMVSSATAAESSNGQGFAYALGHELMSPYCPGRTIASCPSDQAAELLQWMVVQETAGASREEVIAMLEERFGPEIHSSPNAEGWGLAAWLLPAGLLVVGAGVVAVVLRRMVATGRATAADGVEEASSKISPAESGQPVVPPSGPDSDLDFERMVDAEFAASER